MKRYLIYTTEGYTESPSSKQVENCQVLGEIEAENCRDAIEALFSKESWISDSGYSRQAAIAREIA